MRDRPGRRRALAGLFLVALLSWASLVLLAPVLAVQRADRRALEIAAGVYLLGGFVCHQRPDRSFHVGGVQQPVCARCVGLYAAAPLGATLALAGIPLWRVRSAADPRARRLLMAAAAPTVVSLLAEWSGVAPSGPWVRLATAIPLGMVTAWLVARTMVGAVR